MKEAALIQVHTSVGQTRHGPDSEFTLVAVARNHAGCVTIVRGITAAYPEISLPGIVPRPGRTLYSSARGYRACVG